MRQFGRQNAPEDPFLERLDYLATLDQRLHRDAVLGVAVVLRNHQVLRDVDQAAREVAGVRGLECRVGEALARAVRRDEVLQHVETFAEVGRDRRLDDRAVGLRHQSPHPGELPDLRRGAARAGVGHHVDRVERLLAHRLAVAIDHLLGAELLHHHLADLLAAARPDVYHLVVALADRDQARGVLAFDLLHLGFGRLDHGVLLRRNAHVVHAERDSGAGRHGEARLHQLVGEYHRLAQTAAAEGGVDQTRDFLLLQRPVEQLERQPWRQDLRQQGAANGRFVAGNLVALLAFLADQDFLDAYPGPRMQVHLARIVGAMHLGQVAERHALALGVEKLARGVVQAEHDVLRRHDDRLAVGGRQDVVRGEHERSRLHLRLERKRNVHRHLVAVEVGVERRAHQRMELDRLAFDQHRLERLDAEAVQRRRPVQHHRVLPDHLFQDVPHFGHLLLHQALGGLDSGGEPEQLELVEDERLEQLEGHFLRQSALVQLELRTNHDYGTAGIVHALAEQVLAEAAALALDHVRERLQRALVGPGHRLAAATVVEQRIDRLLQHALLVAHDDFRRFQLKQPLQAVVPVDNAPIQVVQIRGCEAPPVQRHQWPQLGRQHRQHFHHHPVGLDVGVLEALEHLEALGDLLDLGFRAGRLEVLAQVLDVAVDVDRAQQRADALRAHGSGEVVAEFLDLGQIVVLGQKLAALERRQPRVGHHVGLEIQHALDVAQRHVEHQAEPRGQRLQEPDVRRRARELDVAHALAPDLGQRHFDAALLADHAAMLEALVLAAQALIVLDRPENLGAEQAVTLRLEGPVVDRLRLLHLAVGPGTDLLGRSEPDFDRVKILVLLDLLEELQ